MRYLYIIFILISCLTISYSNAQVENVIVETYYVSDQFDSTDITGGKLDSGSVTYRIYVDLPKNQKLLKIYGDKNHLFSIKSTEVVFNNQSDGLSFAKDFSKNRFRENTVALDSWLTLGQTSKSQNGITHFGVLKSEDNDGSFIGGVNNDGGSQSVSSGLLTNTNTLAGMPLTQADGMDTLVKIPSNWFDYGVKDFITRVDTTIFGSVKIGKEFSSDLFELRNSGTVGVDPEKNQILIGQITTKGELSFEINLEVEQIINGISTKVKYVANNNSLLPGEIYSPFLKYPFSQIGCTTPTINPQSTTTFCQGGSVVLNASTGAGYTYEWYKDGNLINGSTTSSYTTNQSGSYTVKVINGSCNATSSSTTVTVNPNPTAVINAAGVSTFCQGGSVVLNASTGAGYTYEWYKNGTIINGSTTSSYTANQTGSYTVKVINGSCNATSIGTAVTVNPNPTVSLANLIHIKSAPITLSGSPSGGTYSGPGVVGSTFSSTNAGLGKKIITYNYKYTTPDCICSATAITTVYDTTACSTFDTLFIKIAVAGLTAPNNLGTLKIWPNPANDHITIDNGNFSILNGYSVKIETVLGQEVFKSAINQQQFSVDLSTWKGKGIYLVHVLDAQSNIIETKKIVLQ